MDITSHAFDARGNARRCLSFLALMLLVAGCKTPPANPFAGKYKDDLDRTAVVGDEADPLDKKVRKGSRPPVDLASSLKGLGDEFTAAGRETASGVKLAAAQTLEQAKDNGRQVAANAHATASDLADETLDQAGEVAAASQERIGEVQSAVQTLRQANLPDAARQKAVASLEQMSADADAQVRLRAAQAMGEVHDNAVVPALVTMLNDTAEVQRAAMASLTVVAGHDVTEQADGTMLSQEEQARRWQMWYRDQQGARR